MKKTKADVLSVKEEKFCQLIAAGTCKDQSDAYRKVWKPKKAKAKTVHEEASRIRNSPKIDARIQQLMAPVVEEVRVTREQWLKKMESFFLSDVRKMFDQFGNPIDIPNLGDHEAIMVDGFEFEEQFTKVKSSDGTTDAVPTGYIKKYKLTPKLKAMLEFGKVMGWYTEKQELGLDATLEELVLGSMREDAR